jgi:flagellar biogenesis protein FliO
MIAFFLLAQASGDTVIGSERWTGGGTLGLMLVTLVLFVGLGVGAWYLSQRMRVGGGAKHGNLRVLETRPLGGRQFLMVVAYGDERLLLSVCPGRVEYLSALPQLDFCESEAEVVGGGAPKLSKASFSALLEQLTSAEKKKV